MPPTPHPLAYRNSSLVRQGDFSTSLRALAVTSGRPITHRDRRGCELDCERRSKIIRCNGRPITKATPQHVESPVSSPQGQPSAQNKSMLDELTFTNCCCNCYDSAHKSDRDTQPGACCRLPIAILDLLIRGHSTGLFYLEGALISEQRNEKEMNHCQSIIPLLAVKIHSQGKQNTASKHMKNYMLNYVHALDLAYVTRILADIMQIEGQNTGEC